MNTDKLTTLLGIIGGIVTAAQGAAPATAGASLTWQNWAQISMGIIVYLIGYFANKQGTVGVTVTPSVPANPNV